MNQTELSDKEIVESIFLRIDESVNYDLDDDAEIDCEIVLIDFDLLVPPVIDPASTHAFWALVKRRVIDAYNLANPEAPAEESKLIARDQLPIVREIMEDAVTDYFNEHAQLINERLDVKAANRKEKSILKDDKNDKTGKALEMPSILPPLLLNTTVGAGKSKLVKKLYDLSTATGLPLAVLAPTHQLCDELAAANKGMAHYYGRVESDDDKGTPQNICYRLDETEDAANNNHRVAAALCIKCEHGQAGAIKHGKPDDENVIKAIQWFKARKLEPANIKPCRFLYEGLPAQLAEPRLVAPHGAFSEAIGLFNESDRSQTQRLIVIDEHIELTEEVEITIPHIDQWINNIDALAERMRDAKPEDDEGTKATLALLALLPAVRLIFANLSAAIHLKAGIDFKAIIEMQKAVSKAHGSTGGTAKWEQITRAADGFSMPLRALNTLAYNARSGTLRRHGTKLYIFEIKPILKWAIERGSVIFLDATASALFKDILRANKGKIVEMQVEQNMSVSHITGHLYARGRTPLESNQDEEKIGEAYRRAARKYMKEIEQIAAQLPSPGKTGVKGCAVITHKAYLKYSGKDWQEADAAQSAKDAFETTTGAKIGWFGKHDRGHNDWKQHHIAIVGMPLLSSENVASAWGRVRAATAEVGIDLPEWDGLIDSKSNSKRHHQGVYLPLQDDVRAFVLDNYAATIAQAIGRARALNSDAVICIELWGGLQTAEFKRYLLAHGVEVGGERPNEIHRSARTGTAEQVFWQAVELVQASGKAISSRSIRDALAGQQVSLDDHIILAELAKARDAGKIPPASKGGRPAKPQK